MQDEDDLITAEHAEFLIYRRGKNLQDFQNRSANKPYFKLIKPVLRKSKSEIFYSYRNICEYIQKYAAFNTVMANDFIRGKYDYKEGCHG